MIHKIRHHKDKVMKEPKLLIITLLILALIIVVFMVPVKDKATFNIEDKCGKFVNLFQHTIGDESACKTRCASQCESSKYRYKSVDFTMSGAGCNTCVCHCR